MLAVIAIVAVMDFSGIELGPKMLACSDQERAFVWHLVIGGAENATDAARLAGWSDRGTGAIKVQAHRVSHRERVIEAMEELGRRAYRAQLVPALLANKKLIENDKHPDHARTVRATLASLGLGERTAVDVNVSGSVDVNHTDAAVNDLRVLLGLGVARGKLEEIFGFSGLARYEKMLAEVDRRALPGPTVIDG